MVDAEDSNVGLADEQLIAGLDARRLDRIARLERAVCRIQIGYMPVFLGRIKNDMMGIDVGIVDDHIVVQCPADMDDRLPWTLEARGFPFAADNLDDYHTPASMKRLVNLSASSFVVPAIVK